jgi:hypothetical protein
MASLSVYNPLSKNEHPCLLQVLLHTRRPRIPPSARSVRGWSGAEVSRLPLRRFLCYGVGAHSWLEWQCRPSVFPCNLQYQPVRGATTREEFPWPHMQERQAAQRCETQWHRGTPTSYRMAQRNSYFLSNGTEELLLPIEWHRGTPTSYRKTSPIPAGSIPSPPMV